MLASPVRCCGSRGTLPVPAELFEHKALMEQDMRTYDSKKNTTEARQGDKKTWSVRVLIIATVSVVVLFALIWWIYSMQSPPGV